MGSRGRFNWPILIQTLLFSINGGFFIRVNPWNL
jgi:hypothetical protein